MRNLTFLLFLLLSAKFSFSQTLSKEDITADLEFLKLTLPEKHTNLFAKTTRQNFEQKVEAIKSKADMLNYDSFSAELFKLMVSIGDEHTFVEQGFTKVLPIQFGIFKEGIFVTSISPEKSNMLLSRLVSINGKRIEDIIMLFKEAILHENPSFFDARFLEFINKPAFLKGLGIIPSTDEAIFKLADQNGSEVEIKLPAAPTAYISDLNLSSAGAKLLSAKQAGNYWFDYDQAKKTLYFNYKKCREEEDNPFEKFNTALFDVITKYKPDKIVLDLRWNSGGSSGVLGPFIENIKSSYLNKKGHFFVLIGKQTFSSAVMNAVELKRNSKALFIGEPTSGNINHYGEVRGFNLPNSKIVIAYSTRYWENWKGKKGPLMPDVTVDYSVKNYGSGKDEALEFINNK